MSAAGLAPRRHDSIDGVREPANRRVVVDAYARGVTPKQTAELK